MNRLRPFLSSARDLFVSLQFMIVLLILGILLVLAATLDQVNLGIWSVQEKYIRTFLVFWPVGDFRVPIFPGGYLIGGLLLANLVAAHIYRFTFEWRKTGILVTHAGLIVLLLGELTTGLWQEEFQMRLDEGETKNYSDSYQRDELAVVDTTDAELDQVVAVPAELLAAKKSVQHARLPFRVETKSYFANSSLAMRFANPAATASGATQGVGTQLAVTEEPLATKTNARNLPSALVELIGPDGSLGTWLVSSQLSEAQQFEFGGRTWELALRPQRKFKPYSLTLLKFSHDRYPGTEIPRNFSSRLHLSTPDGRDDREVLISMNNPLRHGGYTFYQAGFENNDRTSVLQVVRNPGWLMPYLASVLMGLGLVIQFGIHLTRVRIRRLEPALP